MVMPAICAVYIYVIVYVNSRVTVFRVVIAKERERGEMTFFYYLPIKISVLLICLTDPSVI
jgi:hypothetical protein